MAIQGRYDRHQPPGFHGMIARANEACAIDTGQAQVPSAGANRGIRPGDVVYYDSGNNGFALPTNAAQLLLPAGIVLHDQGVVASNLTSVPSGANSDTFIQYDDGDFIKVASMGVVWAIVGSNVEYDDLVNWNLADGNLQLIGDPTAFANVPRRLFQVVSPTAVTSGGLAQIRITPRVR